MNCMSGFKNLNFEKSLRLKKNYFHFLFVHKNDVTYLMLKKTGTATVNLFL